MQDNNGNSGYNTILNSWQTVAKIAVVVLLFVGATFYYKSKTTKAIHQVTEQHKVEIQSIPNKK
jgi:hypothetical protein